MKSFMQSSAFLAVLLAAGSAPAGAQLVYTAPNSTGLFAGTNAGNTSCTGGENTGIGYYSLNGLTTGFWNTGVGSLSLTSLTTGVSNTGVGSSALVSMLGGARNTAVGGNA